MDEKWETEKRYSSTVSSLFRVHIKMLFNVDKEKHEKYVLWFYDTPSNIWIKWQMDVKYVPKERYSDLYNQEFYQYAIVDEASRERFFYPYKEQSLYLVIAFAKRAIVHFGYNPEII